MKSSLQAVLIVLLFSVISIQSRAHCEIPCGIYGDSLRVALIAEHIETIEKSMNQINELSKSSTINYNQLVRWVSNKEEHAKKIQEIVSQYFLHQRIKVVSPTDIEAFAVYANQLSLLHQLQVYSMKAKQTTDLKYIQLLNDSLRKFNDSYFHTHTH